MQTTTHAKNERPIPARAVCAVEVALPAAAGRFSRTVVGERRRPSGSLVHVTPWRPPRSCSRDTRRRSPFTESGRTPGSARPPPLQEHGLWLGSRIEREHRPSTAPGIPGRRTLRPWRSGDIASSRSTASGCIASRPGRVHSCCWCTGSRSRGTRGVTSSTRSPAAGYRAVAIDVRGYGRSSAPAAIESYRMMRMVARQPRARRGARRDDRRHRRPRLGRADRVDFGLVAP